MGGVVGGLWDTVQGKKHVRRACDKVFKELEVDGRLKFSDLHLATMMVYSSVNKQYLSPYKEPPTKKMVDDKIKELVNKKKATDGKTREKQEDATKEKQEKQKKQEDTTKEKQEKQEKQEDATKSSIETENKKKSETEQKKEDGSQTSINKDEFYEIILEWLKKDLQIVLANKLLLALMGGPALAIITKSAGRRVPKINNVVEKIPTPVLIPAYATGIALLQDVRLE